MRHVIAVAAAMLVACGGLAPTVSTPMPMHAVATPTEKERFGAALAAFESHEARGDWARAACFRVAKGFDGVALAVAAFDAGVALERCDQHRAAIEHFERALAADPNMRAARLELAVTRYKVDGDVEAAIRTLEQLCSTRRSTTSLRSWGSRPCR